jgi:hypothetical protein
MVKFNKEIAMQNDDEVAGQLSAAEAELMGAFTEDAISEEDARASVDDDSLSPAEALGITPTPTA